MKKRMRCDLLRGESGASLVELAVFLPLFGLLVFSVVDFGRAFYVGIEIAGAARAGAVYGSQNPSDTAGMTTAAQDAAPDVTGLSLTPAPSYGCECAIASSTYVVNCPTATKPTCTTSNLVYRVTVTATGTYSPLFPWPGVPHSIPFTSTAKMRSQ